MEVHNFSIFILRLFSILISALIEKKRKWIWRKYPLFSPLSATKSGVSILPIIWRKSGTEYGENFHFFLRFFSIMIFPFFSPLSAIKSGVSILPSIRFSAFRIWRIYGDLRYGPGGVMIEYKDSLVAVQAEIPQVKAQKMWAKVESRSSKPTLIGAYYRPPSDRTPDTVDDLNTVMENLDPDCPTILGDYNVGDIIWESNTVAPNSDRKPLCERLIPGVSPPGADSARTQPWTGCAHYGDVIMDSIASQITSLMIVYSTDYSDADQRKHQSSASLAFVRGIHRGPVNSPHKWPVKRKIFLFDDVIMATL